MRLNQLTRDLEKLKKLKEVESQFKSKIAYYERVIEELTSTNTELMVQHLKFNQILKEKAELNKQVDSLIYQNRELSQLNQELEHKL